MRVRPRIGAERLSRAHLQSQSPTARKLIRNRNSGVIKGELGRAAAPWRSLRSTAGVSLVNAASPTSWGRYLRPQTRATRRTCRSPTSEWTGRTRPHAAGRTDTPMTNPTPEGDASTPAAPRATVRVVGGHLTGLDSALAVWQSPALKTPAGLQQHSGFAALDAVVNATSFAKTFDTPAILRWSTSIGPHVRVAELAQMQSLGRQLTAALDAFAPQRAALAAAAVGLSRHQDVLAAQLGQIVSAQDSIARLVAGSDLVKSSALFDTIGRYSQIQMQLGAFAAVDHTSLLRGLTRVPPRQRRLRRHTNPAPHDERRGPAKHQQFDDRLTERRRRCV